MTFGNVAPKQLSDGNSQGTELGINATDKISFYGLTPLTQRTNPNQAAASQSSAAGTLLSIQTVTLSPSAVSANTTASQAITVTGTPTNTADFIVYNKVAAQAGLGIVNAKGGTTANTIILNYCNLSTGSITPTATESGSFATLRGVSQSVTLTPAAVTANTTAEQQFTVTGVAPGMLVAVTKPTDQAGLGIAGCRVVSNNLLGITFMNATGSTITPTAGEAYTYVALNGLSAQSNVVILGANVGTLTGVATITTAEQAVTVTGGVLATDLALGVSKPTQQAGLGLCNVRVSAANVLGVAFVNPTAATVTPTASEVYTVPLLRQNPGAPLTLYSVSLSPSAVGNNTTAEQAFTVTGVAAQQLIAVNKPSFSAGLGIVGTRTSAANSVAITFANPTSATITPPTETYLIGAFTAYPSAGSYLLQNVLLGANAAMSLTNELRQATVNLGLILGA